MTSGVSASARPATGPTGLHIGSTKGDCDHALVSNEGPSRLRGDAGVNPCGRGAVCDRVHAAFEQHATGATRGGATPTERPICAADHKSAYTGPKSTEDV